jgi:hypothetical protein
VLGRRAGTAAGEVELAAGAVEVDAGGGELGRHTVGRASQQHLGVVPATQREQRPRGGRGQERAVPPPEPLAGRQLGALRGDRGRGLQPPEALQQARQGGVAARDLVDLADRHGDPARLAELLDAGLEVAEEGEVHPEGPAGVPLLGPGADLAGDRDRLLAQLARLAVAALSDQGLAEGGQDLGTLGQRRAVGHQAHGRLVLGEGAIAAGRPQVAAEPRVQQPGPHRVRGRVHVGERRPGQRDGAVRVAGQEGRIGRVLQHRGAVQAEALAGVGHLGPQLQRQLEVTLGVGEPVGRLGLQSRRHRRGQRPHRLVGPDPVVGEPRRRGDPLGLVEVGALGQGAGEGGMQPGPLPGQQLAVQRLLGQRVPQGIGLGGRVGNQHLVGDGGSQRGEQLRLGQLADRGQ